MALTDDIALYALGRWMHESHPLRIDAICLNKVQWKMRCDACAAACPAGVDVAADAIDWGACTNCNQCITVCPTSALNEARPGFDALEVALRESGGQAVFACERYEGHCDIRRTCIATLPWDLLAGVALSGTLVLKLQPCRECPDESAVDRVKELMRNLRAFLGKERFERLVTMKSPERQESAGARKRQAFMQVAKTAQSEAEELVAEKGEAPVLSRYRAFLLDVLDKAPDAPRMNWQALVEDGQCRACGACVAMCPHHALELVLDDGHDGNAAVRPEASNQADEAGLEDTAGQMGAIGAENAAGEADEASWENEAVPSYGGKAVMPPALVYDAALCTQCGMCYLSCPEETLGGWDRVSATREDAQIVFPLDVAFCETCGRPFKPQSGERRCERCSRFRFL